jgi:hypothetical protein
MNKIFFYGLFMDRSLLIAKGLHPEMVGPAVLFGRRIHIGERATLLPSPLSRVYGVVMEIPDQQAHTLYSEPSVRDYRRERVVVEMLEDNAVVGAFCYVLPREHGLKGTNPEYARNLARLVETLGLDSAYAREIEGFGERS